MQRLTKLKVDMVFMEMQPWGSFFEVIQVVKQEHSKDFEKEIQSLKSLIQA